MANRWKQSRTTSATLTTWCSSVALQGWQTVHLWFLRRPGFISLPSLNQETVAKDSSVVVSSRRLSPSTRLTDSVNVLQNLCGKSVHSKQSVQYSCIYPKLTDDLQLAAGRALAWPAELDDAAGELSSVCFVWLDNLQGVESALGETPEPLPVLQRILPPPPLHLCVLRADAAQPHRPPRVACSLDSNITGNLGSYLSAA